MVWYVSPGMNALAALILSYRWRTDGEFSMLLAASVCAIMCIMVLLVAYLKGEYDGSDRRGDTGP